MFKEAYTRLSEDGAICIFPEGTSHDRPDFIRLKAGLAFMTLGAMAEYKCKNVKIVPIGLNYFKREEFRSEVVVEVGLPFEVPTEWAEEFKIDKRSPTEKLLNVVESRMKSVTYHAPSMEELKAIFLFRNVYIPKNIVLSPTAKSELSKRFVKGYNKLKEKEELKALMVKGCSYIREIEEIALNDEEIVNSEFKQEKMKRKFLKSVLLFFIFLILVTPGLLIVLPFIVYVRREAEKERIIVSKVKYFRRNQKMQIKLKH